MPENCLKYYKAGDPWLVVHDGRVYNYYCAVNSKGERFIALATSE